MFDNRYTVVLADTEESRKIYYDLQFGIKSSKNSSECNGKIKDKTEHDTHHDTSAYFIVLDNKDWRWLATLRVGRKDLDKLPDPLMLGCDYDKRSIDDDLHGSITEISGFSLIPKFNNSGKPFTSTGGNAKAAEIYFGLIRAAREYCAAKELKHWLLLTTESLYQILRRCGLNVESLDAQEDEFQNTQHYCYVNSEKIINTSNKASQKVSKMFEKQNTYCNFSKLTRVFSDLPGTQLGLACA